MHEEYKLSPRMRLYYFLIVGLIVLITIAAGAGIIFFLGDLGTGGRIGMFTIASLMIVITVVSALMSYFIGRRVLMPMVKLSNASKEVARGNFSITVSDSSRLDEVQTTFRSFNAMVRELESTAALSNDFVANVSHEFKTPLTAIEGYAMLLQDSELTAQEREEYLDKILANTQRLTALVGNVLMLSRMENKQVSEQYKHFRLDEQLRQAVVSLEPEWAQKDLNFNIRLDKVDFFGAESLLPHVWTNLIGNAVKFSKAEQEIIVSLLEQKECVVVTVTDGGCGMSKAVQARIFEKFYQGDASHKSPGNGLGLPLAKRIVELCDGVIEVESAPDEGTTFRVILPKAK